MKNNAWNMAGNGGTPLRALLAAAALFALAAPGARAQQEPAPEAPALRTEVARLKREIQRADAELARDEQAAAARNRERLARDKERREKENAALEGRVRDARGRIASERARGEGYAGEAAEIQAREKSVLTLLALVTDSLAARVNGGMPWETAPRRDRILSLERDITAGATTPEEAFSRLAALLKEETKNGDEVSLASRPLTRQNGEVVNAQVLKIGNQAMVYVDDEGKKFGILEPRGTDSGMAWTWREDLNLSERSAVKRAVSVKAGREAPQLAPLVVPLAGILARNGTVEAIEPEADVDATETRTTADTNSGNPETRIRRNGEGGR
jgi:hypothetical protein